MCNAAPTRRRAPERGFVLITTVLAMVALLACLGLAIDVGYVQLVKTRMQTAADAAAIGGAQEVKANDAAGAPAAARADAALNGFTDGRRGVAVVVNHPPASGYSLGDPMAVEVVISQTVPSLFLQLAGTASTTVRARAVARLASGTSCLYTLDPTAPSSFSASGLAAVQINCGVIVNSTSSQAMNVSGHATVTASFVSVVGNYSTSGGGVISPQPSTGEMTESDPLAYLPAPPTVGCDQTGLSLTTTRTLDPGVYCNGIQISSGATVTLNPGTYVLKGGGLSVSGSARLSGAGVTFYNTAGGGYSYGAISISGGASINLAAPTTGTYAGVLFYQDRSIASGTASTISGGSAAAFEGTLYFPTTTLNYSGGSSSNAAYTSIVSKNVVFSGNTVLNNDYSSLPGGSPIKGSASLSE
jgi:Putative Flp pilus-assembly TadE/G-like